MFIIKSTFCFLTETEGFNIDTMGTYHGLSLDRVKVESPSV